LPTYIALSHRPPISQHPSHRNKRRLAALVAATTAGGVAAYYTYQLWYKDIEPNRNNITVFNDDGDNDNDQSTAPGPSTSSLIPGTSSPPPPPSHLSSTIPTLLNPNEVLPSSSIDISQRDTEAHLTNHFESILAIANTTTLPSLLPCLARKMESLVDIDGRLDRLKSKGGLGAEEKIRLWKELSAASLTLLTTSVWALPLLYLQIRCQLSILGRRLYLESALLGSHQGGGGRGMGDPAAAMLMAATATPPLTLTPATQESFLACAEHLKLQGLESLVSKIHKLSTAALENITLDSPLDIQGVSSIISAILSSIRPPAPPGAISGGWAPLLLPSAEELRQLFKTKHQDPDNRAALFGAEALVVDRDAVGNMVEETWRVVSSVEFDELVTKCSKYVAKNVIDTLEQQISRRPLAKIVPMWVAVGREVMVPEGKVVESLRGVTEVKSFMAAVYASPLM
jgi:hypothetical protein